LKHLILISGVFILSGIVGYITGKDATATYEGSITCLYNDLHKKTYGEMIEQLNHYIKDTNYPLIGQLLNINETLASDISGIKAVNVSGSPLQDDFTTEKLPFYIIYTLKNPQSAHAINIGVLYYLRNCTYNREHRKIIVDHAFEKIRFIDHQLQLLDSMKEGFTGYLRQGRHGSAEPVSFNIKDLYKESQELFDSKLENQWSTRYDNSVEILYESYPSKIVTASTRYRMAIISACGITLFLLALLYLNQLSKAELNEQK
jgi:hypothetical protein